MEKYVESKGFEAVVGKINADVKNTKKSLLKKMNKVQLAFNADGELEVTINGVTKVFVPKQ